MLLCCSRWNFIAWTSYAYATCYPRAFIWSHQSKHLCHKKIPMSQSEPLFFRLFKRHVPTALLDRTELWRPHVVEWDCGTGAVITPRCCRVASVVKDFKLHHSIVVCAICVLSAMTRHDVLAHLIVVQVGSGERAWCTECVHTAKWAAFSSFGLRM